MMRTATRLLVPAIVAAVSWSWAAAAEPAAPPPPKKYTVVLRFRIDAARAQRVAQFRELVDYLEALGFQKDPGPPGEEEDPSQNRMTGTIPSDRARRILDEPRVKAVILMPEGYKVPDEADKPVPVRLRLAAGFSPDAQRRLEDQVRERLRGFGFVEAVGYDHRGHTRLAGSIPAGELYTLLTDLRWQPAGWLLPEQPIAELPLPIKNVSPVLLTEVVPDAVSAARDLPPLQGPQGEPEPAEKITADLRALMEQKDEAAKPRRLEVILSSTPPEGNQTWRRTFARRVPGVALEGRLGPLVTVLAPPEQATALAELPIVSTVRLPRPALEQSVGEEKPGNLRALLAAGGWSAGGSERPHRVEVSRIMRRVAVLDSDFRGYKDFLGKGLPANTRLLDFTEIVRPDLQPEPYPQDGQAVGQGTRRALALVQAAPKAQLTLIRVDPSSPYQVEAVARAINGEPIPLEGIDEREAELSAEDQRLQDRREELRRERKVIASNFGDDPESMKQRRAFAEKQARLEADQRALDRRRAELARWLQERGNLRGIQVVWSGLVWNEGYPLAGGSTLSHYFDDRPFRAALWLQSAGDARGQTWTGLFRDADGNRAMEFAPPEAPLRPKRWTSELNFFGWQPVGGKPVPELPDNAVVRVSVQWREPHDPEYQEPGADVYRRPLATLRLVVLRQPDPEGEKRPADDLEVVAWSSGLPQRLDNDPRSATYEQVVEFKVHPAGRYALRVEGLVPKGIRPAGAVALPGAETQWELRPRIFVETVDAASRKLGRVIFLDYATDGGPGMPADSREIVPVRPAGAPSRPRR
jgi:hypothetical protein